MRINQEERDTMETNQLTKEQELLLLTSKLTLTDAEKARIIELSSDTGIRWFHFFQMAMYHKTATLCWSNIDNINPDVQIPTYLYYMMRYGKKEIALQNEKFLREAEQTAEILRGNGIQVIPVKGVRFVRTIYGCSGTRFMGDFDYLVRKSDGAKIREVMHSLGYMQGKVNFRDNTLTPLSRAEEIKWKMSVSNFAPYIKLTDDPCNKIFKFDFRHSLDDTLKTDSMQEILDYAAENGDARPAHLLIHLAAHFYGEAKRTVSMFLAKDFNIIKITDIREFVLRSMNAEEWDEVVRFAKHYGLAQQVYFTLYITRLLFHDGYESEIMERLGVTDESFLYSYGDNTLDEKYRTERSLEERIFACDSSEIAELPSFLAADETVPEGGKGAE